MKNKSAGGLTLACLMAIGLAAVPAPAVAAADDPYGGIEVLRGLFASNDHNRDGRISVQELQAFSNLVFVSMDANDDGRVTLDEFMVWDPGFMAVARERGKVESYEAAKRHMFGTRDRDRDGSVSEVELFVSNAHDFIVADDDQNGSLNPGEFAFGYPVLGPIAKSLR